MAVHLDEHLGWGLVRVCDNAAQQEVDNRCFDSLSTSQGSMQAKSVRKQQGAGSVRSKKVGCVLK